MKQRRTIESLFRENSHKFSEQPRPEAWERLEQRLGHRKVFPLRFLSIAAAVALLILAGTVLMLMNNKDQRFEAMLDMQPGAIEVLDAADANPSALEAIALVEFYKEKKRREAEENNLNSAAQPNQ